MNFVDWFRVVVTHETVALTAAKTVQHLLNGAAPAKAPPPAS